MMVFYKSFISILFFHFFDSDLLGSKGINIDNSQDYLSKIYCFNESQEPAQTGDYLNGYVDKGLTTEFAEQFGSVKDDLSVFLLMHLLKL